MRWKEVQITKYFNSKKEEDFTLFPHKKRGALLTQHPTKQQTTIFLYYEITYIMVRHPINILCSKKFHFSEKQLRVTHIDPPNQLLFVEVTRKFAFAGSKAVSLNFLSKTRVFEEKIKKFSHPFIMAKMARI